MENEDFTLWLKILKIDIPDRSLVANFATKEGYRELTLKVFSDELLQEILEQYQAGKQLLYARIASGQIIQALAYLPSRKSRELSNSRQPIYHSLHNTTSSSTELLRQFGNLDDKVKDSANLVIVANKKSW